MSKTIPDTLPKARPNTKTTAIQVAPFLALPPIIFYAILLRKATDLPLLDDYEMILDFLNRLAPLSGAPAKLSYFFSAQFNEYKLFLVHGIAWLLCALAGHINFEFLCALGNCSVLLLALLLWSMFLPGHKDPVDRMVLFIPACWLLFQLQYAETLNWAGPSLSNLPVLVFSLGAIYFLVRRTRATLYGSLLCLVLAVSSLGNGLLLIPVGSLILVVNRRYRSLALWLAVSACCIAAYAFRYDVMSSQTRSHESLLRVLAAARPLYVIVFIGNAGALGSPINLRLGGSYHSVNVFLSLLLGLSLCGFFVFLAKRRYLCKNPTISYCILYLLLSAVGVACLRSDFGVSQSISSRYKIYSALLVIFAWFAFVEEFLKDGRRPSLRKRVLPAAIGVSVLFSLSMDWWGWSYLSERNQRTILGMAQFEHPVPGRARLGPVLPLATADERYERLMRSAPEILQKSIQLGIYKPPSIGILNN